MLVVGSCGLLGALRGDLGDVFLGGAVASRRSRPDLPAEGARGPPKMLHTKEWRRAKNISKIVVWRACAPKVMENVTYFGHPEKRRNSVPRERANYITHSDIF